jgi:hypothetical protein
VLGDEVDVELQKRGGAPQLVDLLIGHLAVGERRFHQPVEECLMGTLNVQSAQSEVGSEGAEFGSFVGVSLRSASAVSSRAT